MDTEQIKILLERYNQGTCSPEEADIIEQWFDNINRHQSVIMNDDALNLQLDEVKHLINEQITPQVEANVPQAKVRNFRPWYLAVAAAALLAAVVLLFTNKPGTTAPASPEILAASTKTVTRTVNNGFVEVTTPNGLKETITLEDGSTIVMNGGTKVRYPEHFTNAARQVFLDEGEAMFDATHDAIRSFIVYSGDLSTVALGTSFNIRAYASEADITVALITGKVKVEKAGATNNGTILMPSEQLRYNRVSLHMIKSSFSNPDNIIGWRKGYLIFDGASFNDIAGALQNRFGVTVINNSNKIEWNYKGSFTKNESLSEVLDVICTIKSLTYTIKSDTVYLEN
ncbi:FecR family protein [Chitinophaga jiangningensis]|uniref:FecR family protein n=1 Tax=Chitinophaga jiangningensis TaxID=1419482 RepID=A0A1M7G7Y6_9BACT|nr:FecR family protein [Chitinophaga jiangningensis]SHM12245.1 FecR family protein [Chitinophaga jiangningensis]